MIRAEVIAEAKAVLDVPAVWKELGLPHATGKRAGNVRCPFHEDRNASLSLFAAGRGWKCHAGCGQGDAVAFLQRARNYSKGDTLREFVRLAGLESSARFTPRTRAAIRPATQPARPCTQPSPPPWPAMHGGDTRFHARLATLRNVSTDSVNLAVKRGLVAFGEWRGAPAWFVRDRSGRVAQARRLDGTLWNNTGPKALTLPGGCASWPVGLPESEGFPLIALCEGGPDLLAALHFAWCEDREDSVAPVAMLGAAQAIHEDALPLFHGRRVRIFGHHDWPGHQAACNWTRQLTAAGATVDTFDLSSLYDADGAPLKDLNDLTRVDPDTFEADRTLWNLFG